MSKANGNGKRKLADFTPQRKNANRHTPRGMRVLSDSIGLYGIADGITVAANGESISGAARLETLAEMMPGVTIREVETFGETLLVNRRMDIASADDPKAQSLSAAANVAPNINLDLDGEMLALLSAQDAALANILKQDDKALKAMARYGSENMADAEPQIDRAAELNKKWKVKTGDLWRIGAHRLLCGDSTKREDVERVMGGEKASITFTSPPYNAGVSAKLRGNTRIGDNFYGDEYNDGKSQGEYLNLLEAFTIIAIEFSAYVFVNIQPLAGNKLSLIEYWHKFVGNFADVAVWDKTNAAPEQARRVMDSRFEFIIVFSKDATRAIGTREFRGLVHNVFTSQPQRHNSYSFMHAATFPIELPVHFIGNFTNADESLYEPFAGTGTTLVACENLHRRGRGIEISPAYCAVILERMASAFPGIEIERVSA